MTHHTAERGFALLIAMIFMAVMLALGLALGALVYKQQVLASSAVESQYAFYAADAGMECALYADQQKNTFEYPTGNTPGTAPGFSCDGVQVNQPPPPSYPTGIASKDATQWILNYRIQLDANTRCAYVTIYKPPLGTGKPTYIFSQGFDVSCDIVDNPGDARLTARGVQSHY